MRYNLWSCNLLKLARLYTFTLSLNLTWVTYPRYGTIPYLTYKSVCTFYTKILLDAWTGKKNWKKNRAIWTPIHPKKRPNPENEKKNSPFPQFLTGREAVQGSSSPDTLKKFFSLKEKHPYCFFALHHSLNLPLFIYVRNSKAVITHAKWRSCLAGRI